MRSTIVFAERTTLYTPPHLPTVLPTQRREIMADVIFGFYLMCFHNLQEPQQTGIHYVCHAALSTHLHEWPWSEGAFLTVKCRIFCFFFLCSPQMIWHHIREKDDTSHGCCRVQSNLCDKMETVGGDSWEHRSRALWQGWGRERGRSPSHHHLSALQDFSPFLEQLIDHLLYWDHLRHRMKINVSCTQHSRQLWTVVAAHGDWASPIAHHTCSDWPGAYQDTSAGEIMELALH